MVKSIEANLQITIKLKKKALKMVSNVCLQVQMDNAFKTFWRMSRFRSEWEKLQEFKVHKNKVQGQLYQSDSLLVMGFA